MAEPFHKGQIIANCGALGLDWRHLSISAYMETLEAHNEASDPANAKREPRQPENADRLRRFKRAHFDGGNGER